ncbi:MAG TPA: hypothetical protein GXX36_04430 [Clostridiaceae bacterium]|nr:hypothetical protein [Clostridiaceae bacterium]
MIIVGDGYIDDDCVHHGVCAQKAAESDNFAIKGAEIPGKRLVDVCKRINSNNKGWLYAA